MRPYWLILPLLLPGLALSQDRDAAAEAYANFLEKSGAYETELKNYTKVLDQQIDGLRENAAIHREAFKKGLISRLELDAALGKLAAAEANRESQQQALLMVRHTVVEVEAAYRLQQERQEEDQLIRFTGSRAWDLRQVPDLEGFFRRHFGRELPVSAYGQTDTHVLLGFDHQGRLDVAVHPHSTEGKALMALLRELGVPFSAFGGPLEGSATGAHIHVGPPSPRVF